MKNKNLILRTLTGIVYVALITAGILLGSFSFLILFSFVTVFCLSEFYGLVNQNKNLDINPFIHSLGGLLLFVATFLFASGTFNFFIFSVYLFYLVATFVLSLYRKENDPLSNLAFIFFGQLYVALPISLLNLLAFLPSEMGIGYTPVFVLALFIFIWVNDTGAYVVGISIGKHRLFERISPKKSWEGFFGGLAFTVLSSLIFHYYYPEITMIDWMIVAAIVVVFATWGDLIESLMKRTMDVKDSGSCLPGHGGFLDRFDSLLFAVYGMLFFTLIRNFL